MFLETLKASFLILLFFGLMAFGGYWAVTSLQVEPEDSEAPGSDVRPVIVNEPVGFGETEAPAADNPPAASPPGSSGAPSADDSSLRSALQKLIDDNVLMKNGSRGTRVGTVQEFLNLYNGTDTTVDNDYGPTTETQVRAFQRAEGITADGQAGPGTYQKMIEWLDDN